MVRHIDRELVEIKQAIRSVGSHTPTATALPNQLATRHIAPNTSSHS